MRSGSSSCRDGNRGRRASSKCGTRCTIYTLTCDMTRSTLRRGWCMFCTARSLHATPLQSDPSSRVLSARMAHVVSYLILNNIRSRRDRSPRSRHPRRGRLASTHETGHGGHPPRIFGRHIRTGHESRRACRVSRRPTADERPGRKKTVVTVRLCVLDF